MASSGVYIQYILSRGCMPSRRLFHKFFNCWLYIQLALDNEEGGDKHKETLDAYSYTISIILAGGPSNGKIYWTPKSSGKEPTHHAYA